MSTAVSLHHSLQGFAASVTEKSNQFVAGEPEEQLRAPFERFMHEAAIGLGCDIVCTGEAPLPDRLGRPDYAIHLNRLLAGYVELKAPASALTPENLENVTASNSIVSRPFRIYSTRTATNGRCIETASALVRLFVSPEILLQRDQAL